MVALLGLVSTISTNAMGLASAELYHTEANFYGRFEARIRFAPGDGVVSSFFLWKEGSEESGAYWNELDFEKIGADCRLQTNSIYGRPSANHNKDQSVSGNLCNEYHDYRFEWTPTYIAWVIDGKEIRRDTGAAASAYSENATAGMTFHFNIWPGTQDFGGNINNTTLPVREYISWAQYSAYNNGNFELKWRQEFDGETIPDGWLVGDWNSPMGQSTHNTKNVGFANGIAILAITADNATGNLGTSPVDPKAGGSGGNGGSSGSGGVGGSSSSRSSGGVGGSSSSSSSASGGASVGGNSSAGGTTGTGGRGGTSASGGSPGGTTGHSSAGATGGSSESGGQSASSSSSGGSMSSGGSSSAASSSSSGGASGGTSSSSSSAQGGSSASSSSKASSSAGSSGGSSSSGGSRSSASTSSDATGDSSSSGCGCRFGQASDTSPLFVLISLIGLALLCRNRRKGV